MGRRFPLIAAACAIPAGAGCFPRVCRGDVHQLFHALAFPKFVERKNSNFLGRCDIVHVDCHWHSSGSFSHETSNYDGRIVAGATKFFEVVDELNLIAVVGNNDDAVGVLSEHNDFVIFIFVISIALMKASKFLFTAPLLFTALRCGIKLFWRIILVPFISILLLH